MEIVWKLEFGIWFGRNLAERIRRSTARLRVWFSHPLASVKVS